MPPKVINPDHIGVKVQDMEGAIRFYRDVLGLELTERHKMPNGTELVFLRMGATAYVELIQRPGLERAQPVPAERAGLQHLCLQVASVDEWVTYLGEQNVPLTVQPFTLEFPSGPVKGCFIADPEGNPVELMERVGK
jgi:catechol 2,3-dioxygenase-like lactoylglutathione lyase family enzyme